MYYYAPLFSFISQLLIPLASTIIVDMESVSLLVFSLMWQQGHAIWLIYQAVTKTRPKHTFSLGTNALIPEKEVKGCFSTRRKKT